MASFMHLLYHLYLFYPLYFSWLVTQFFPHKYLQSNLTHHTNVINVKINVCWHVQIMHTILYVIFPKFQVNVVAGKLLMIISNITQSKKTSQVRLYVSGHPAGRERWTSRKARALSGGALPDNAGLLELLSRPETYLLPARLNVLTASGLRKHKPTRERRRRLDTGIIRGRS